MAKEKIIGVYRITNKANGKVYIGSSVDIKGRWNSHISDLSRGVHRNQYLQNAWNKYGKDNFVFEIIEKCSKDEINLREQYWIDTYNASIRDKGYNILPTAYSNLGFKPSKETIQRMSDAMYKRWSNEEYKQNAKINNLTQKRLQEHGTEGFITSNKLTKEEALEIFNNQNEDVETLAKKYNVTPTAIHDIWKGKTWYIYTNKEYVKTHTNLSVESVLNIVDEYQNKNVSIEDIARKYNTRVSNIRNILRGLTWTEITGIKPNKLPRKSQSFPLYQIDVNGNVVNYFESSDVASEKTGYNARTIRRACLNHTIYKGYEWIYKKDYEETQIQNSPLLCSNE